MQRVLAGILAVALLPTFASAVPRHVHSFAGHEHEDHQHEVAAHMHVGGEHSHRLASHAADAAEIERCDPGTHAVALTFVCASPESGQPLVAVAYESVALSLPQAVRTSVAPADVRTHGPPRSRRTPPRAPPVVHPA